MKNWLTKYKNGGDKSKDLNYRDDYSKSKSNMNMLELSKNTPAPKKNYKFDPKTIPNAPANMQEAQQMVDAKEKHKDKVTASEKLAYSRMTKAQKEKYNTAKAKEEYVNNPGFMDYASQIGYMPLLAMSNPFNMGEKLKELRAIKVNDNLSPWQKFDQMGNISTEATGNALINAATEGLTEGLAPVVVNKLAKYGDDAVNLAKNKMQNAYKYNPWAFKADPKAYYRGVGKEGIEDALKSGAIKSRNQEMFRSPFFARPGEFETALYYNPEGLVEAKGFNIKNLEGKSADTDISGLHFERYDAGAVPVTPKYTEGSFGKPETKDWYFKRDIENIPLDHPDIKLYEKHWLKGYKEVPKTLKEGKSNFKSEIDWGNWNKEIPDNKGLMDEYHTIEQTSKSNKSWMKNPDGSEFDGTPEQFVQQNSKNFKKSYSKGVEKVYRGTDGEMNTEKLAELYPKGRGVFTADKKTAQHYAGSKGKLNELYHPSSSNSYDIDVKGRSWREVPTENLPNMESKKTLFGKGIADTDDIATWAEKNNVDYVNMKNIFDGTDAKFSKIVNNKPGNYLKSTTGNNGMFDMTNPNIYKALVPAIAGSAAYGLQEKKNGGWLTKFK